MRNIGWLAIFVVGSAVGWACTSDGPGLGGATTTSTTTTTTGGGGNGNGGGPNGGCPDPCPIQCDAIDSTPSAGACVEVSGPVECNPITNAPCDSLTGEACDFGPGGFRCYDSPNELVLCEACTSDAHCQKGFTCSQGACAKFCCDDGDCGKTGHCETVGGLPVGICMAGGGSSSSSSSSGSSSSSSSSSSASSSSSSSSGSGGGGGGTGGSGTGGAGGN